jgi:hypothetical protein
MEAQKLCVYNSTRESYLGHEVAIVDPTVEPLRKLIEYLAFDVEPGLWLTPYRGIPPVPGIPQFDLVCLDEEYRVIEAVPSLSTSHLSPLKASPASALVLPLRTISSSQTQPGDRFMICTANELVQQLALRTRALANVEKSAADAATPASVSVPPPPSNGNHAGEQPTANQSSNGSADTHLNESLRTRLLRWWASDRRTANRQTFRNLVAYRWDGEYPHAHRINDISESGLYLVTPERLFIGTRVLMTLQKENTDGYAPGNSIAVQTKVVRWGEDGEGLSFVLSGTPEHVSDPHWPERVANKKALKKFLQQLKEEEQGLQMS